MNSLADKQSAFMAQILAEDAPVPRGWGERHAAGMQIYRLGYRARLVEALSELFEKTSMLTGGAAFRQVAANHVISRPPASWTLDDVGAGFAVTCAEFFHDDPAVAELAALEWAMHEAVSAADATPIRTEEFARKVAEFSESDWLAMRLAFAPGCTVLNGRFDLIALWKSLEQGSHEAVVTPGNGTFVVWREGERPTFIAASPAEGEALAAMLAGASYGEIASLLVDRLGEEKGVAEAGSMLGGWIASGLVCAILD